MRVLEGTNHKRKYGHDFVYLTCGTYCFIYMPFGLQHAPAGFRFPLDIIQFGVRGKKCFIKADDLVIISKNEF